MTPETVSHLQRVLERAARILRIGALLNGALAGLILVLGIIGALRIFPDVFATLHRLLLFNTSGADDATVTGAALLALLNLSLLLVLGVGALAREMWTLAALAALALANVGALVWLGYTPAPLTIGFALYTLFVILRDRIARGAFRPNPVMIKELRGRMRGVRAFVVLTIYLSLMGGFAMLLYLIYSTAGRDPGSAAAGEIGRVLFNGVFAVELLLIIFIAPAFTAGSITGERERQTYDLLRTTLLSNASFVIGKLESALGYVMLLLLAGIPLQAFAFLFGGVSETELILSLTILVITAITLGTIGIYFSAGNERTLNASVRAYSTTLLLLFVVPSVISLILAVLNGFLFGVSGLFPYAPLEAVFVYLSHFLTSINPLAAAVTTQNLLVTQQIAGFYPFTLSVDGTTIPLASPWINFSILYTAAASILLTLTIRAVRHLDEREQPQPR